MCFQRSFKGIEWKSRLPQSGWKIVPQSRTGCRETPVAKCVVCLWHEQLPGVVGMRPQRTTGDQRRTEDDSIQRCSSPIQPTMYEGLHYSDLKASFVIEIVGRIAGKTQSLLSDLMSVRSILSADCVFKWAFSVGEFSACMAVRDRRTTIMMMMMTPVLWPPSRLRQTYMAPANMFTVKSAADRSRDWRASTHTC